MSAGGAQAGRAAPRPARAAAAVVLMAAYSVCVAGTAVPARRRVDVVLAVLVLVIAQTAFGLLG
jgi:hypothetical protein